MSTTRILEGFKASVLSVAHCISGSIVGITWADLRSCCDGLTRLLRWEALNLVATRSTTSKADRRRRTIGGRIAIQHEIGRSQLQTEPWRLYSEGVLFTGSVFARCC